MADKKAADYAITTDSFYGAASDNTFAGVMSFMPP